MAEYFLKHEFNKFGKKETLKKPFYNNLVCLNQFENVLYKI